jgi:hypothetical protein
MCARMVPKSQKGEGLAYEGREVSDRRGCCQISGQYGLVPVEVSLGLACGRVDTVRLPDLRRSQSTTLTSDVQYFLPDFQLLPHVGDRCTGVGSMAIVFEPVGKDHE